MEPVRVATFDCYGTLIDWEGGAAGFLYEIARRHERHPPPGRELRARWEELQFERLQGDYRGYREVLADSLAEWAGERGYRWNDRDGEALARSMESWQPFPDTVPALRAAKEAGLRLWIISNTDRAIMDHSLRHLEVEFDGVTVAEDCRAYKPERRAVPARAARDRRLPGGDPPRGVRLQVRPGGGAAPRDADGVGEPGGVPAPGPERPDLEWRDLWPLAGMASEAP